MKTVSIKLRKTTIITWTLCSVFAIALSASVTWQNDFSGKWRINVSKSDFGNLSADEAAPKEIRLTVNKDSIGIERILLTSNSIETYRINGNELVQDLTNDTKKTSSVKWPADGKQIIVTSLYKVGNNGNPWEYTRTETYTLSTDGKTLTLYRVTVIPDRTDEVKAVYDRAK